MPEMLHNETKTRTLFKRFNVVSAVSATVRGAVLGDSIDVLRHCSLVFDRPVTQREEERRNSEKEKGDL